MRVVSQDKTISDILKSNFFKIPRFQRAYSWNKDNVLEFWQDTINTAEQEYFIGSMVVFKDGDYLGVVDGQQRLTTITIALAAIRNNFLNLGLDNLAEGLQNNIERKNLENKNEFVLQTESSYPFFHEKIQKMGKSNSSLREGEEEKTLRQAFEQIGSLLKDGLALQKKNNKDPEKLKKLAETYLRECRDKILKLKLIFIELDNEDDAYIIFETLNTRGKDLEISDLAKNHFLKLLRNKNVNLDLPKDEWRRAQKEIESSDRGLNMNNYIHHYWISKFSYIPEKKIFKDLKIKVTESNVDSEFEEIIQDATNYRSVFDPSSSPWTKNELEIRDSMDALNIFNVKQPYPALLAAVSKYKEKKLRLSDLKEITDLIEKFHFVSSAITGQRSSGGLSNAYSKFARELRDAKNNQMVVDRIKLLKKTLRNGLPTNEEFVAAFSKLIYTDKITKDKHLIQYILKKMDKEHRKDPPVEYERMTIEHLLPQSGNSIEVTGMLGNLIYVSKTLNQQLGAKPFTQKMKILEKSGYPFDTGLEGKDKWDAGTIKQRTQSLAHLAYKKIWKV